jgi:hypothetical protein
MNFEATSKKPAEGQCPASFIFEYAYGRRHKLIRCIKPIGHADKHYAAWGGSQAWRQAHWDGKGAFS